MGVIKKILYKNNILSNPEHNNLFLDMEENIHIHYRDIRIEMSLQEFKEFTSIFKKQSKELLQIINKNDYQDGKVSNSNQDSTRIWTESKLKNNIKYYPKRLSIEECGDGYHFHYRNYKILLNDDEFKHLSEIFKNIDLEKKYAETYDEVLELLYANDINFIINTNNKKNEILSILVHSQHMPKVRDIFNYIGFNKETKEKEVHYIGSKLLVIVKKDIQRSIDSYKQINGHKQTERLVDYLITNKTNINPNEINDIKCQVLDIYYALLDNKDLYVETNPQLWLYVSDIQKIIFPYKSISVTGKIEAEKLYKEWNNLLSNLELNFIKPTKKILPKQEQEELKDKINTFLDKEVASFAAVDKIFVMGSFKRGDMGIYEKPFVHGKMVKIGSDVDILIEINQELENDIPEQWGKMKMLSSNHCYIYHIGQIPLKNDFSELYPNIKFTHHLIDAYVFFPSKKHSTEKDEFLKKFGAKCFFDRSKNNVKYNNNKEENISKIINKQYQLENVIIEKMNVSTRNTIYKIFSNNKIFNYKKCFILKLFKVSGNYNSSRIDEHVTYEKELINQLKSRNILTAGVIPSLDTKVKIDGYSALLFERIKGEIQQKPEYALDKIGHSLAKIHLCQMEKPLELSTNFTFDDVCMMWLPQYSIFPKNPSIPLDISKAFEKLMPLVDKYNPGKNRQIIYDNIPFVHCHGDVTPKNVIINDKAIFFDFNNAFYGPRIVDIIDGSFEFSLAEKYINLADFNRFDMFIKHYTDNSSLTVIEKQYLKQWIELIGLIKFIKEVRVLIEKPKEQLRRQRALAISNYIDF